MIFGFTIGYIVGPNRETGGLLDRINGIDGYNVLEADPNGDPRQHIKKHWIPATAITPAVVGRNVCRRPWPTCGCPLRHARPRTLARLVAAGGET